MKLLPIPTDPKYLQATAPHWYPFLERIAQRSGEPVNDLLDQIGRLVVQPILAWDDEKNEATALSGIRRCFVGDSLMGDLVWMTGGNRETWQHLLDDLEHYLKEDGCIKCRAACRPGWSRFLKQRGYKMTHIFMEKNL